MTGSEYLRWYLSDPDRRQAYMTSDLCKIEVDRKVQELDHGINH